jgi:hypothetical protein
VLEQVVKGELESTGKKLARKIYGQKARTVINYFEARHRVTPSHGDARIMRWALLLRKARAAFFDSLNAQYQCFIDDRGYENDEWWAGLKRQVAQQPAWTDTNQLRETVCWYEAVAFSRWLDAKLRELPYLGTTGASPSAYTAGVGESGTGYRRAGVSVGRISRGSG